MVIKVMVIKVIFIFDIPLFGGLRPKTRKHK